MVCFLFLGQILVSAVSHSFQMIDDNSELLELYNAEVEDSEEEREKEEDTNKEQDDIVRLSLQDLKFHSSIAEFNLLHPLGALSAENAEVTTPPPELS
jgi:hypothetical protein